jgi:predicted nucleic acid-binding protein
LGFLIDSTVVIHAERSRLSAADLIRTLIERWGDAPISMSVISAGELFHGCWRAGTPARRAVREDFIESLLSVVPVAPVTLPVARIFGQVDARLSASGQRIPTSDLLIASTALLNGDKIITGDARHFDRVSGLKVLRLVS